MVTKDHLTHQKRYPDIVLLVSIPESIRHGEFLSYIKLLQQIVKSKNYPTYFINLLLL